MVTGACDARRQLLDLRLADPRFEPALVETVLASWSRRGKQAIYDPGDQLARRATQHAEDQLLRPTANGERMRMVLRDARLFDWRPLGIQTVADRIELAVGLTVVGVRYLTERISGEHRHGSQDYPHHIDLRWRLRFTPSAEPPWCLVSSTNPAHGIPGVDARTQPG